jgi:hypothetical protein
LNLPAHETDRDSTGIQAAYVKYLAYCKAKVALAQVIKDGKWPLQQKPKSEHLIEAFISRSAFFRNYQPNFPGLKDNYPTLHRWLLNDGDDMPTDIEAWGFQKNVYMFKDLEEFLEKGKGGKKGKKKAKDGKKAEKSQGKKKKANRD